MPEPHATVRYRGYDLVQWREHGSYDICLPDGTYLSIAQDYEDACAVVDGWLLAR